jgi:para-aminobenzoate synthetase component 1
VTDKPIAYLNSNDGTGLIGLGDGPTLSIGSNDSLETIQEFIDLHSDSFIFSTLNYDLKELTHGLKSNNIDSVHFPLAWLWVPDIVISIENNQVNEILKGELDTNSEQILEELLNQQQADFKLNKAFQSRTSKEEYLEQVNALLDQIQYGNIYEANFCQEFYAEDVTIENPIQAYHKLNALTKAPFSAFISFEDFAVFCGSPERYIKKEGKRIISQPIKGTSKRGATAQEDALLVEHLRNDPKERSENVMIVDLVRNDLSIIASPSSVNVDELFGIYTFETVHQMISTISCEVSDNVRFIDVLKASFPMGSMTGAPKRSAMELIEEHENFKRGLYSGSIGVIKPNGDFDLNVVIRTMLYNHKLNYISCPVGGAITIQSDPEKEYEECNIKIRSIIEGMNA